MMNATSGQTVTGKTMHTELNMTMKLLNETRHDNETKHHKISTTSSTILDRFAHYSLMNTCNYVLLLQPILWNNLRIASTMP